MLKKNFQITRIQMKLLLFKFARKSKTLQRNSRNSMCSNMRWTTSTLRNYTNGNNYLSPLFGYWNDTDRERAQKRKDNKFCWKLWKSTLRVTVGQSCWKWYHSTRVSFLIKTACKGPNKHLENENDYTMNIMLGNPKFAIIVICSFLFLRN